MHISYNKENTRQHISEEKIKNDIYEKNLDKLSTKSLNSSSNFNKYLKNMNSKSYKGDLSHELNPDSYREINYDIVKVSKSHSVKSHINSNDENENNIELNNFEGRENIVEQNNDLDKVNNDFILENYSNLDNFNNYEFGNKIEKEVLNNQDQHSESKNNKKKESPFIRNKKSKIFLLRYQKV